MKILVTGGNGQVAYDLARRIKQKNFETPQKAGIQVSSPTRSQLDISNQEAVSAAIESFKPNVVINAAAYTQVDRAETERERALSVNCDGAKNIAIACQRLSIPLLHLSTDYVFDGDKQRPYLETDAPAPLNFYGESKLQGEKAIQEYCEHHIILRVSAVFGVHGQNFVKTMLKLAYEREQLRIVSDQITCPTPAAAIADTLLKMCEQPKWGLFHYCGSTPVSWYDFAKMIIAKGNQFEKLRVKTIDAIPAVEYPTPAKRPMYSVLNCEKLFNAYQIQQPSWEIGLTDVITYLYTS